MFPLYMSFQSSSLKDLLFISMLQNFLVKTYVQGMLVDLHDNDIQFNYHRTLNIVQLHVLSYLTYGGLRLPRYIVREQQPDSQFDIRCIEKFVGIPCQP
jgi:hypothetical protein